MCVITYILLIIVTCLSFISIYSIHNFTEEELLTVKAAKIVVHNYSTESNLSKIKQLSHNVVNSKALSSNVNRVQNKNAKVIHDIKNKNFILIPAMLYLIRILGFRNLRSRWIKLSRAVEEVYGKPNMLSVIDYLYSKSLMYIYYGVLLSLALFIVGREFILLKKVIIVSSLIFTIAIIFSYSVYEEVLANFKRKKQEVKRDFPQVVSKMYLLINAGLELTEVWKQTASSSDSLLYQEMQIVSREMDNGISITKAMKSFIARNNMREISRLSSTIEQAQIKGNSEIASMFKDLVYEVWFEKKQLAKRAGEIASNKLVAPLMLIFIGIMTIILVPILANMNI